MSSTTKPTSGYLGESPSLQSDKFMMIDGEMQEIHNIVVHRFKVGDVDDPEIYAAQPLWEWEQSEAGKWIKEHAIEVPQWHRRDDPMAWHTHFAITAKLKDKDFIIWVLKYKEDK
jgi:hypothetical protein